MTETNIRAVIWDLGGVLLRTEDPTPREQAARRFGVTVKELSAVIFESESSRQAECGEIHFEEHNKFIANQLGITSADIAGLFDEFFGGDCMDTDLKAFICSLRPRYRCGLLSNAWGSLRQFLEDNHADLLSCFDTVIISAEAGMRKPDGRIFQLALKQLEVAPQEAVFIDDLEINAAAARENGLHAIHFTDPQQAMDALKTLLAE